MAAAHANTELASVQIHEVLSNERRQRVLALLRDEGGEMSARELSERIAEFESGESPPPRNIRQSVYVSLHQTHLPKLDELGIVEYDQSSKTVRLEDRAGEVSVYLETVPKYGISWSEYYLGVSVLGLLLVFAADFGVPVVAEIGVLAWSSLLFAVIALSAVYQTIQQGSSMVHRLLD